MFTENDLDAIPTANFVRKLPANGLCSPGYRADGKNGARVAALARWLAEGQLTHGPTLSEWPPVHRLITSGPVPWCMAISDIAEAVAAGQTYIIAEIGQNHQATWRLQSS